MKTLRLDKYLCDMKAGSRSKVKEMVRQGLICVNNITVDRPDIHIDENYDNITVQGRELTYRRFVYYMLHKPAGVVCAARDNKFKTVNDLMDQLGYPELFSVGRLDKDTEGLVIMTNDGALAHALLSPKKHVEKVYYVRLEKSLTLEDIKQLEQGVDIGESKPTLPAKIEPGVNGGIYLTLTEGKYHQVKRMMQAVGNRVLYLKRVKMGGIALDDALKIGFYRELREEETALLRSQL